VIDTVRPKPDFGRFGARFPHPVTPREAADIEQLGYCAIWVGGSPAADLSFVEPILAQTETLRLATGVVNIWSAPPDEVAASYHRIEKRYPGRFLLGIGAGHRENTLEYAKPYGALVSYLDALDAAAFPTSSRVIAALGPRMLRLSRERSAGAHPFLTTPEHTAQARELLGDSAFLAPEHKAVLTAPGAENAGEARALGRKTVGFYLGLSNYVNNWRRLGFTPDDVEPPGSDRLIDAVVAYGTAVQIAARLSEHLNAGADHVAVQVLGSRDQLIPALAQLAGPLGLQPRN
jgi:probable F420-dependent oxidoreductase